MMEDRVLSLLPRHGIMDCVNLKLRLIQTLLPLSCPSSVRPPFATPPPKQGNSTAYPTRIPLGVSTRNINHLDIPLIQTITIYENSHILVRFPNSEAPSSAVGLFLSTIYTFTPFIRCFSVFCACLGRYRVSNSLRAVFACECDPSSKVKVWA